MAAMKFLLILAVAALVIQQWGSTQAKAFVIVSEKMPQGVLSLRGGVIAAEAGITDIKIIQLSSALFKYPDSNRMAE